MVLHVASASPVVLVVGGTSGIGLATASLLSADDRDVRVAIAARDDRALARAAAALPGEPMLVPLDLTDGPSVAAAVDQVMARFGRLDAVVTTAQVMAYGKVDEVPVEVLDAVVSTAIQGTAHLVRAVLPVFRQQGHGNLVVVSSLLARIAVPEMGAYNAAKWGQLGLVRALQMELRRERRIHVCLVSPGAVDTPIYDQAASYAGSAGSAPPPVVSAARVARAVVDCLDKPRRHVEVGPVNRPAVAAFRLGAPLYDRLAAPLVRRVVLRGPAVADHSGNTIIAFPEREAESGGWTPSGRRRSAGGRPRWRRRGGDR
ncbi:SDR family NAD(P)-dependent oxidoreductase [Nocardioides oleivorans]|uniref:SDR family NAD(P)-dependent oxidoreductase n=1 Tax=Nocardioides oleivorans TaxID=273676 RepID=A0A4Q2S0P8_9ACTN|nr:SDR family NAD(P)-dependent oxidoreductase [Nocardioides oleivorans]RYB94726.1 SDR family NAD(P)-dependent oxidoreductase [Nocardioides oleivorans]